MGSPNKDMSSHFITLHYPEFNSQSPETPDDSLEGLLNSLSFQETADLTSAGQALGLVLTDATINPTYLRQAWTEYEIVCNRIIDNFNVSDQGVAAYNRTKLALMIHKTVLFRDAQRMDLFIGALDESETLAQDCRFYDVGRFLEAELKTALKAAELSPESLIAKLRGEISEPDRKFLRDELEYGSDLKYLLDKTRDLLLNLDDQRDHAEVFARLGIVETEE